MQITISYGQFTLVQPSSPEEYPPVYFRDVRTENHVSVFDAKFSEEEDPTRLVCCIVPIIQSYISNNCWSQS